MVKEPFMKIIFDVCQPEDPNGGIDIFFFFHTSAFLEYSGPKSDMGKYAQGRWR